MSDIPQDPFTVLAVFLNGNASVNDDSLKLFAKLGNCRSLQLVGTSITDEGIRHLKDMESLERIELSRTGVTDTAMTYLSGMPKLSVVTVDSTKVTERGLRELKNLPAGLAGLSVSPSNAPDGIEFLKDCPLTWLAIFPGDSRAMSEALGKSLATIPKLRDLFFTYLFVTDVQAKYIADVPGLVNLTFYASSGWPAGALAHLSRLSNLEGLFIYDSGGSFSAEKLQRLVTLTKLTNLEIQCESADADGIAKLRAALPDCKIRIVPKVQNAAEAGTKQ